MTLGEQIEQAVEGKSIDSRIKAALELLETDPMWISMDHDQEEIAKLKHELKKIIAGAPVDVTDSASFQVALCVLQEAAMSLDECACMAKERRKMN